MAIGERCLLAFNHEICNQCRDLEPDLIAALGTGRHLVAVLARSCDVAA